MSTHINPDDCPIQDIHKLFGAILDLASNEAIAFVATNITRAHPSRLESIAREKLTERRRALHAADLASSQKRAAEYLAEIGRSRT
ncbi:hypothetical protein D8770_22820 [Methylobacterium sp. DB1607]|nr:hypothetical protein [Methylobacterium sp. DB1607]